MPYLWGRMLAVGTAALVAWLAIHRLHGLLPRLLVAALFVASGPGLDLWRHGEWRRFFRGRPEAAG